MTRPYDLMTYKNRLVFKPASLVVKISRLTELSFSLSLLDGRREEGEECNMQHIHKGGGTYFEWN